MKIPARTLTEQLGDVKIGDEPVFVTREISSVPATFTGSLSNRDFDQFGLHESLRLAIDDVGYITPTLIQGQAIGPIMDKKDVLGVAKTGSGKTAAFSLPILHNLIQEKLDRKKQPTVLVVTPTRELAIQIGVSFDTYGRFTKLKQVTIFGGVSQKPQVDSLRTSGFSILVATPGRLLDLIGQKHISLKYVQTLILDEADRMLDMGFIPDVKRIVEQIPLDRQSLLFSATMPAEVLDLAKSFLNDELIHVTGDQQSIPINKIKQEVYFVEKADKLELIKYLLSTDNISRAIVFTRTKHGADKLVKKLKRESFTIEAMHGNKSQNARQRALANFKSNKTQILIATDLAARGLDMDDISHVINYDLPMVPETYMHRIGRTARAGKSGNAISFCSNDERKYFAQIERLLGVHIPRALDNPLQSEFESPPPTQIATTKIGTKKSTTKTKSRRSSSKKEGREFNSWERNKRRTGRPKKPRKSKKWR
ncbi:MAG: DEAD/DEAH box helicase [Candidatus Heimdallarchaeota archaeon]|nr:DEAD/DEAH box helicase [Candidatus Heimdallarchaeota archaeon]